MATPESLLAIQQIYVAYYGRPADPAGLEFWATELDTAGGDLSAVISRFATSSESVELYGEQQTPEERVNIIYENLLGRPAEPEGLEFWLDQLSSGEQTADSLILAILQSARNEDAALIDNKVALATTFT